MLPANVKDFIYVDVEGIDLLYSQTVDRLEVSQAETKNRTLTGKVGVSGKLKSVFLGFLGQAEVNASTEATGSKGTAVTTTRTLSVHGKLKSLIEILDDIEDGVCFSSLPAAAKYSLENSQKVFFCGKYEFDAPQFITGNGPQSVTESGYLLLQCGYIDRYLEGDDYYKQPKFKAEMACSILKMPRCSQNRMSEVGHDAVYFRGHEGNQIPVGVFSSVIPIRGFVQLKPYAVWI